MTGYDSPEAMLAASCPPMPPGIVRSMTMTLNGRPAARGLRVGMKCGGSVRNGFRFISEFLQHRDYHLSHCEFVVHNQGAAMSAESGRHFTRLKGRTGGGRQAAGSRRSCRRLVSR